MPTFRTLRADEIDCRIGTCTPKGVSLLLYKDARCDQNVLDESVGSMNWQRHHSRDNANCTVSIWDGDKKQWVEKEDTGTESNTEKEKGLASDSFKRACFNWGIGRELYTAPFIWIKASDLTSHDGSTGKWKCNDRFSVKEISYKNGVISSLVIMNNSSRKQVFSMGKSTYEEPKETPKKEAPKKEAEKPTNTKDYPAPDPNTQISVDDAAYIKEMIRLKGADTKVILGYLSDHWGRKVNSIDEMTEDMLEFVNSRLTR